VKKGGLYWYEWVKSGKNGADPMNEAVLHQVVVRWNGRAWKSVIAKERTTDEFGAGLKMPLVRREQV